MKRSCRVSPLFMLTPLLGLIAGCHMAPSSRLSPPAQAAINTLWETRQTHCVGRYLVDLPKGFAPFPASTNINDYPRLKIHTERLAPLRFEQRIKQREAVLRNTKTYDPINGPYFRNVYTLNDINRTGVIFSEDAPGAGRILEGHLYHNGVAFQVNMEARDNTAPEYKDDLFKDKINNIHQRLTELKRFFQRLSGREAHDIPNQRGVCFTNGFLADPPGTIGHLQQREVVRLSFGAKDLYPKIGIKFETHNALREKDTMLERTSGIKGLLANLGGSTLRKGKRTIDGMYAEEWLTHAIVDREWDKNDKPIYGHVFNLIVNEKTGSIETPALHVTLQQDPLPDETLDKEHTLALWQAVTESIRLRR